jgi:hypothetical protein
VLTNGLPFTLKHGWPYVVVSSASGSARAMRSTSVQLGTPQR